MFVVGGEGRRQVYPFINLSKKGLHDNTLGYNTCVYDLV